MITVKIDNKEYQVPEGILPVEEGRDEEAAVAVGTVVHFVHAPEVVDVIQRSPAILVVAHQDHVAHLW